MQLNKVSRRTALETARRPGSTITITDRDFGWEQKSVTYDEMLNLIDEYGANHWVASQYEGSNIVSIDTRSKMHFEVTLKKEGV